MDDVASNIQVDILSSAFGGATTCSTRPNCDGVHCVAVRGFTSDVIIDPCQESVRILLKNTSSNSIVFDQSYPQSAEYPLPLHVSGLTPKLSVGIVHYNFSMKLSVSYDCIVISCARLGARVCLMTVDSHIEMWRLTLLTVDLEIFMLRNFRMTNFHVEKFL